MKRPQEIAIDLRQTGTIVNLTSIFENLASLKISQIKNQVQASQQFFDELWNIYEQIRVDNQFRFGRTTDSKVENKILYVAVTSEGGFSGDIDQRLIRYMLKSYDPAKQDIVIIGHHGAVQLTQLGVTFQHYYRMPLKDQNINVKPLIDEISRYSGATVFYQSYVSLSTQDIKQIDLSKAVQEQGNRTGTDKTDVISEENYIFEPSTFDVVAHLEGSMLQIALTQFIFESKLAQYASRFRAMSAAQEKANDSFDSLQALYNHSKRTTSDERLKEIVNSFHRGDVV